MPKGRLKKKKNSTGSTGGLQTHILLHIGPEEKKHQISHIVERIMSEKVGKYIQSKVYRTRMSGINSINEYEFGQKSITSRHD